MNKGTLCDEHGQKLVKKSANKILRMVRTCPNCIENFRNGLEELCYEHNNKFDAWQVTQIESIRKKCDVCARGAE